MAHLHLQVLTFVVIRYSMGEVIGKNCRFLQSPDGEVRAGEDRKYTGGSEVYELKKRVARCSVGVSNCKR